MNAVQPHSILAYFHPLLRASSLRKRPVHVQLAGKDYVLFRDHNSHPVALAGTCPHRHTPLWKGTVTRAGTIRCPYHGWTFDSRGEGHNPSQPDMPNCNVQALSVVEREGYLWLAQKDGAQANFPELGWEGAKRIGSYHFNIAAPIHVVVANICDVEHLPTVHASGLGFLQTWGGFQVQLLESKKVDEGNRNLFLYERGKLSVQVEQVVRFAPVHIRYTAQSANGQGAFTLRNFTYFTPKSTQHTLLAGFWWGKFHSIVARIFAPLIMQMHWLLTWYTTTEDARFLPSVAHTRVDLQGMRLDRLDVPVMRGMEGLRNSPYAPFCGVQAEPHIPSQLKTSTL